MALTEAAKHLNSYIEETTAEDKPPSQILDAVRVWIEANGQIKACF